MTTLNKYIEQTENNTEINQWILSNLNNYLKTNPEDVGEIEHIIDYFKYRLTSLSNNNKQLKLKKMSYNEAKKLAAKWVKTLVKQAKDIVETEDDVEAFMEFNNGLRVVKLVGQDAFKREGKLMSHCVSSYFGKKGISVYSLRDNKNVPHCTIEVSEDSNGNVNQIKGKGNGSIHPRYIKNVLAFLKKINKEVRESEMTYLGYDKISDSVYEFIMSKFPKTKYITYKGSNFIYRHQRISNDTNRTK